MKYELTSNDPYIIVTYVANAMRKERCNNTEITDYLQFSTCDTLSYLIAKSIDIINKLNGE